LIGELGKGSGANAAYDVRCRGECYTERARRRDEMLGFYKNNDFVYKLTEQSGVVTKKGRDKTDESCTVGIGANLISGQPDCRGPDKAD
jgi:hypothetical protein